MGMIGYFAEIDSEKINQLLESTEKPLMDNIHDTLSGLRRLDIDKRWDFLHFGLTGTSAFDPAKNDPLSRAVLGEHSLEDGIDGFLGLTWNQELAATIDRLESLDLPPNFIQPVPRHSIKPFIFNMMNNHLIRNSPRTSP